MFKLVGKFSLIFFVLLDFSWAAEKLPSSTASWIKFESSVLQSQNKSHSLGLSYIISGTIALVGGFAGQAVTSDSLEKGVYTLFQTMGIASIGYGVHEKYVPSDDTNLYYSLRNSNDLTNDARGRFIEQHLVFKAEQRKKENLVRAISHGLIAGFNLYNATQQNNESFRNILYFIGGINLIASVTYTFD